MDRRLEPVRIANRSAFLAVLALITLGSLSPARSSPFHFDAPAGPQFTEQEKQSQRDAGATVVPLVLDAFRGGAASVRIPAGDYRFGQERWGRDGVIYPLEFSGLRRDAAHPFTIDATGVTFWFDLADDQAPKAHFCVGFKDCANLVFRGATLDRATRGHVEGRITAFDFPGNRIELELSPGITVPSSFSDKLEQRVIPFKVDGTFCAPLYALQAGGTRLKYRTITPGTAPGRCWVEMKEAALLNTIRDPAWLNAHGEQGVLRVGDGLSCVYTVTAALELIGCAKITVDGLKVYAPKSWCAEWGGDGGHIWTHCYLGPRPGTSQWQGGEGFMFCATRRGPTLDNVTILHTTDDMANFHGYWGTIRSIAGTKVVFESNHEFGRTVLRDAAPGDRLIFLDRSSGQERGRAQVVATEGPTITVDRAVDTFTNAIVEWPDHACAGWTVRNCHWHDNYQRLLIQSGPGTVQNCLFERTGNAIELNSVMPYVEGGVPRDITIADCVFRSVAPGLAGAAIQAHTHTFDLTRSPQFSNIRITGNTFDRPLAEAVRLPPSTELHMEGNRSL
jgi:hypothetical protein